MISNIECSLTFTLDGSQKSKISSSFFDVKIRAVTTLQASGACPGHQVERHSKIEEQVEERDRLSPELVRVSKRIYFGGGQYTLENCGWRGGSLEIAKSTRENNPPHTTMPVPIRLLLAQQNAPTAPSHNGSCDDSTHITTQMKLEIRRILSSQVK